MCEGRQWRLTGGLSFRDVLLCVAPMSHLAGIHGSFLLPALLGARAVIMPRWNAQAARDLVDSEKITFSLGAPAFLFDLVQLYESQPPAALTLKSFQCGGAPAAPSLIERADRIGLSVFKAYGMSETAGTCSLGRPTDPLAVRANNEGYLNEGVEMEAVDEQRNSLPAGQIGELRVRTPQAMIGYLNPAQTAACVDSEGWFYTGDVGTVSLDRTVRVTGRIKDIINRGGEKLSTQEIECAIGSHPTIASVAVVGIPDERLGETVAAAVTLRAGNRWDGPQPVLQHLQTIGLPRRKQPVTWLHLDALPATASGKVKKNRLIELMQHPSTASIGPEPEEG
jgi:acyl-CoA synthetase